MPGRIHQNDAPSLTLDGSIAVGDTIIPVQESITGVETPISYTINSGGANQEIVTLTSKNTSTSPSQFEGVVRGCDGTADQSHSSGEVLTHEATARDLVDKPFLQSQTIKPSSRIWAYDDFDRSDRVLNGDTLPTGQTWTETNSGGSSWEIIDRRADQPNWAKPFLLVPRSEPSGLYHRIFCGQMGNHNWLILAYQDVTSMVFVGRTNNHLEIKYGDPGNSETLLERLNGGFSGWGGGVFAASLSADYSNDEYTIRVSGDGAHAFAKNVTATDHPDLKTIIDNSTHVGMMFRQAGDVESYLIRDQQA